MAELQAGGGPSAAEESGVAAQWRSTLWAMVGIQFVMTMAFSMLTPIMPLFLPELGVKTAAGIDIWAGILSGVAIGFFAALMGLSMNVWQFFAARSLMGIFAGFSSSAIALVASQVPEGRLGYSLGG